MNLVYALEPLDSSDEFSIFLAGPTPRSSIPSWRPKVIKALAMSGFDDCTVYIPEPKDSIWHEDYYGQIQWEEDALVKADLILFWIPRQLPDMVGLTTNIEWGVWCQSGKVVLGYPEYAVHMKYLKHYADKYNVPVVDSISALVREAVKFYQG